MEQQEFSSKTELATQLSQEIVQKLSAAISTTGKANILFSGGSTPLPLFEALANEKLDWSKVNIGLVDDRMVGEDSKHSNMGMLKQALLEKLPKDQHPGIYPLVIQPEKKEDNMQYALASLKRFHHLDVVVLGMGTDGHFASLFPEDAASSKGLMLDFKAPLLYTEAPAAPKNRISCSWSYLRKAHNLYLHITGMEKQKVLQKAMHSSTLPISTVLKDPQINLSIYWCK